MDDSWDMSWVDRLAKAKARAVFDSPEISDGEAVWKAMMWADQYAQVYGTPRSQIVPVLVFRHMGIALAMNDSYWKRFNVGKEKKVLNAQGKEWAESNPVLLPPAAGSTDPDYSLPKFFEAGGIVLACNLAFTFAAAPLQEGTEDRFRRCAGGGAEGPDSRRDPAAVRHLRGHARAGGGGGTMIA